MSETATPTPSLTYDHRAIYCDGAEMAVRSAFPDLDMWTAFASEIATSVNSHAKLLAACEAIAMLGGNLPDDRLTDKTGPNDARGRGLMYVEARRIARAAIAEAR